MNNIIELIRRKPLLFLIVSIGYLFIIGLVKWRFQPPIEALLYLGGGLLGVYFLDIAEVFFHLTPSPFRTILFAGLFTIVSFFVVTSSGSLLATGLVLSMYLVMILWQVGEWQAAGNLTTWYRMVNGTVSQQAQRWGLVVFIGLFLVETYLFMR